jgi:hypothetical protein
MIRNQPGTTGTNNEEIQLTEVKKGNEVFYKISQVDRMRPFFMTIVSDSNHWLFVSSNGGLSAGRKNSEFALFPYYTDDKITASAENTGSKTILQIMANGKQYTWEPFSIRSEGLFQYQRNLYKSRYGNKIIFEEINHDLSITFQYEWNSSNQYGFVRTATLINHSAGEVVIKLADGLQNVLPFGTGADLQNSVSNLADAYKRSELLPETGLGIFALSAIIVDKAEPSEALKANIVWSAGLDNPVYLLSSAQLHTFRLGGPVKQEEDVKGDKGAYFICSELTLAPGADKNWYFIANVNQTQSAIIQLADRIKHNSGLMSEVLADVETGTKNLEALTAAADGLQYTSDDLASTRHFANVLFNIMRGGIFDDNYTLTKGDFTKYIQKASLVVSEKNEQRLKALPAQFSVTALQEMAAASGDADFIRLATEYLPLKFSRRHGDPSRPWNKFSINTRSEIDGSKILDYQGNWRDIFQNWEALAHSYPAFIEGMLFKFLNASTFDGYNPYRVTKDGFDWETIEPDNPWSYIGYWGDHQIIYLLKFLEFIQDYNPDLLTQLLDKEYFVYANVPYKIKPYEQILQNPKDTIEFNHTADTVIRKRMAELGADGALLTDSHSAIHHVNFTEKIVATLLAKLTNLVPDGGIWMNTQRPEWNDANNALVGNGLSMVTLCYLRRFIKFLEPLLNQNPATELALSEELSACFVQVAKTFEQFSDTLSGSISDTIRKNMTDALGQAGSTYRGQVYTHGFSGIKKTIRAKQLVDCISKANEFLEHSIAVNKRNDELYHTYNLISTDEHTMQVAHLSEMLEGQVAVLSSRFLSPQQSLKLLDALKKSSLYRPDQHSYILYPNKDLPKFIQKNTLPPQAAASSILLQQLLEEGNHSIVEKDIHGALHFNGNFRNANDLQDALNRLADRYKPLVDKERALLLRIFEEVFRHKEFTGRSGTFFGYEGLGSIYWHMVSKLLLAVEETCKQALEQNAGKDIIDGLAAHFHDIKEGIGVHKPPHVYGAFPTDPYSHTPFNKGAQQPGMTGQVKEDILTRMAELGVKISGGKLVFDPYLLSKKEFLTTESEAGFVLVNGSTKTIHLEKGSLAFTVCQVPVIYKMAGTDQVEVLYTNGTTEWLKTTTLTREISTRIMQRTDEVAELHVFVNENKLRE